MLTEKDTIKCESVFNEDHTHRFLWKRVWNKEKPLAAVIMLNPCLADNILMDTTTYLVVNNVARLEEYGGVMVVNLYSKLTSKLNFRWNSDADLNDPVNDSYIRKAAEDAEVVIAAWGKGGETNQRISNRIGEVMEVLDGLEDKIFLISDGVRTGLHPLTPSIRREWILEHLEEQNTVEPDDETSDPASAGSQKKEAQVEKSL